MGDAWGSLCIPRHGSLERFHPDLLADVAEAFKTELFAIYGFEPTDLNRRYFQLKNSLQVGRFLCLKIEDIGWSDLCRHIIDKYPEAELYATLYGEYGERFFFARNRRGEAHSFSFRDDGDRHDVEAGLSDDEKRWLDLVDEELVDEELADTFFPPLLTYLGGRDFDDGGFNWDRFDPGRHGDKLPELQESVRRLHASLSSRTLESCLQLMAESTGKPTTHPKVARWVQAFLGEGFGGCLLALEACVEKAPTSFFGEWEYGFDLSGDGDLTDSIPEDFMKLSFVFKDDLGRFTLSGAWQPVMKARGQWGRPPKVELGERKKAKFLRVPMLM